MKSLKELKRLWSEEEENECELLRQTVEWMNQRNEHRNQDKTTTQLIREYLSHRYEWYF